MKKRFFLLGIVPLSIVIMVLLADSCTNPYWPGNDENRNATVIKSVSASIVPPATGDTPDTAALAGDTEYTCGNVVWRSDDSAWNPNTYPFHGSTSYSAELTLTANNNYTFTGLNDAAINGRSAKVLANTGKTVTLSYSFGPTLHNKAINIAINHQPDNMNYINGQALDLTGLVVTVFYNDTTNGDFAFANFGDTITVLPLDGTELSHSIHDGQPITVTLGKLAAQTDALSVQPKPIENVAITVAYPIMNDIPGTPVIANSEGKFKMKDFSWDPSDDEFQNATVYTITVTLIITDNDYTFAGGLTEATINTQEPDNVVNSGSEATLSYAFEETQKRSVTGITIKEQPVLVYTHGEQLDMKGLVVTVNYDDHFTENVVYPDPKITTDPLNGAILFYPDNGEVVTVSIGSSSTDTDALTINQKALTVTGASHTKVYDGNTDADGVTVTLGGILPVDADNISVDYSAAIYPVDAAYTSANAGTTTLNVKAVTLSGDAAAYYEVTSAYGLIVEGITPKTLNINAGDIKLSPLNPYASLVIDDLVGLDQLVIDPPSGITYKDSKLSYDGTTPFPIPEVQVKMPNYVFVPSLTITVYDGGADNTGSAIGRRIPVYAENKIDFNTYAGTTHGLTRHYLLMENVDLSLTTPQPDGSTWTAIGTSTAPFTGSFDGQGKKISGLKINNPSGSYQGMFGYITNGFVRNLGLYGVSITGNNNTGGIAGYSKGGTIQYCYTTGNVTGYDQVGGIVGYNESAIVQYCYTEGTITSTADYSKVGGIAGTNAGTTTGTTTNVAKVVNCYSLGNVVYKGNSDYGWAGGVVGYSILSIVQNCYATGSVTNGFNIGGIVGEAISASTVTNQVNSNVALNQSLITSQTYTSTSPNFYIAGVIGKAAEGAGGYFKPNYSKDDIYTVTNSDKSTTDYFNYIKYGTSLKPAGYDKPVQLTVLYDGSSKSVSQLKDIKFWQTAANWTSQWDFDKWVWNDPGTGTTFVPPTLKNMPE